MADNLVVGKRVGNSPEKLRGPAIAPNGDIYAKGKLGLIWALRAALTKNAVVSGDSKRLIDVILKGPAAVLPADREKFSNVMPPFSVLSDADIASVITYLRKNFAPASPGVTPAPAAAQRAP